MILAPRNVLVETNIPNDFFPKAAIPQIGLVASRGTFAYNIFFSADKAFRCGHLRGIPILNSLKSSPNQVNVWNEARNIRSQRSGWHFIIAITKCYPVTMSLA